MTNYRIDYDEDVRVPVPEKDDPAWPATLVAHVERRTGALPPERATDVVAFAELCRAARTEQSGTLLAFCPLSLLPVVGLLAVRVENIEEPLDLTIAAVDDDAAMLTPAIEEIDGGWWGIGRRAAVIVASQTPASPPDDSTTRSSAMASRCWPPPSPTASRSRRRCCRSPTGWWHTSLWRTDDRHPRARPERGRKRELTPGLSPRHTARRVQDAVLRVIDARVLQRLELIDREFDRTSAELEREGAASAARTAATPQSRTVTPFPYIFAMFAAGFGGGLAIGAGRVVSRTPAGEMAVVGPSVLVLGIVAAVLLIVGEIFARREGSTSTNRALFLWFSTFLSLVVAVGVSVRLAVEEFTGYGVAAVIVMAIVFVLALVFAIGATRRRLPDDGEHAPRVRPGSRERNELLSASETAQDRAHDELGGARPGRPVKPSRRHTPRVSPRRPDDVTRPPAPWSERLQSLAVGRGALRPRGLTARSAHALSARIVSMMPEKSLRAPSPAANPS